MYLDSTESKQIADLCHYSSTTNNFLGGKKKTNKKCLISEKKKYSHEVLM